MVLCIVSFGPVIWIVQFSLDDWLTSVIFWRLPNNLGLKWVIFLHLFGVKNGIYSPPKIEQWGIINRWIVYCVCFRAHLINCLLCCLRNCGKMLRVGAGVKWKVWIFAPKFDYGRGNFKVEGELVIVDHGDVAFSKIHAGVNECHIDSGSCN